MPNTSSARFYMQQPFSGNDSPSFASFTTLPPSSLQVTGTRLGSFVTLVSRCQHDVYNREM